MNDHSVDKSKEIAQDFAKKFSNVCVLDAPNYGVGKALKFGIGTIETKYVIRMDADDVMLSNRIQEQVSFMELNPQIVLSGSQIQLFGELEGQVANKYLLDDKEIKAFLLNGNAFADPSVIIRRDSLLGIELRDKNFDGAEQFAMWLALSELGKVANLPTTLLKYRIHNGQFTQQRRHEVVRSTARVQLLYVFNRLYKLKSKKVKIKLTTRLVVMRNLNRNLLYSFLTFIRLNRVD